MKEYPIIFSTPMVQAILEGRKTMTRRVIKPQPNESGISYMKNAPLNWEEMYREDWCPWKWENEEGEIISKFSPYGQPGDMLWVRETYLYTGSQIVFRADEDPENKWLCKWNSPIFMPKAAARLWLEIVNVRVQRLEDITEEDAVKEGVESINVNDHPYKFKNYHTNKFKCYSAKHSFASLWVEINGLKKYAENPNPWVWVIEFRRIEK